MLGALSHRFKTIIFSPLRVISLFAAVGDIIFHARTGDVISVFYQDIPDPFFKWLGFFIHVMFMVAFALIVLSDGRFIGDLPFKKDPKYANRPTTLQ